MSTDRNSRFEILEEETHFPRRENENTPNDTVPTECDASQSLEAQFRQLLIEKNEKISESPQDAESTESDGQKCMKECIKDQEKASKAKEIGNKFFALGRWLDAIECYSAALQYIPIGEEHSDDKAIYFSNRAACLARLDRVEETIDDCTQAIALSPKYIKALLRRAEAYEKLDKLEEALRDYDEVLKIDASHSTARPSHTRLKKIVDERAEKMKAEMMEKLKGFGNTLLGKFGLSTDNFKMVQDPNTGSYNINFVQNAQAN